MRVLCENERIVEYSTDGEIGERRIKRGNGGKYWL